ncbi:integrase core domain-containing protein [Bythopirellula goksoeyrii]|uniref:Integrase catalytic domain-containing protein n=1 Tax=Bythopirellula goksoeyrii TaxID=1400387 RepID=A0A5B9QF20_9BACT|nr:hypothetical protein Pr1d_01720 [Bythopirellula goksoeyrii]
MHIDRALKYDGDIAQAIQRWRTRVAIETLYIEPGSPWENGYAESFHSCLGVEFLAREEF